MLFSMESLDARLSENFLTGARNSSKKGQTKEQTNRSQIENQKNSNRSSGARF
jgi:hypothetical protein